MHVRHHQAHKARIAPQPAELTSGQGLVIAAAREAMRRRIEQMLPDVEPATRFALTLVAASGLFADMLCAIPSAGADLVALLNKQIQHSGLKLIQTKRN